MAFGNNIKKLREEKNLTQQQLADKLYVSRQTICRWENGSRCPDLITAKKLALELKVSMDELISDEAVQDIQINYGIWKSEKIKNRTKKRLFCDAFKGIPQFSQNSLFFIRATGQSLCFYKNVSTVAIRQVSRKSNRSFTGTSRTSAISKSLFREIDVFPFGASILLICVRLRFVASASSACVSPRSLR